MIHYFSSAFTLGILGGGQLGKMLLYETRKWDIKTHVLDPSSEAPCKIACNHFQQGDLNDYQTVLDFGRKVDVLTFEIEHVNLDALLQLEEEGTPVYPSPKTLQRIKNKGVQKEFYKQHQIPTAAFEVYASKKELLYAFQKQKITLPFVWKSCEGGYDGMGVEIVKTEDQLHQLPDVACLREDWVPFETELAVIVARNTKGESKTYSVVEMEFHPTANQVEYVLSPARISDEMATKAQDIAMHVSKAFNHVGLLAVELFLTQEGEILVNEVAPRPHNSGHFSIEASFTNQFEQHLRAVLGLPLGDTSQKLPCVMVNLVGAEGFTGNVKYEHIAEILALPGVTPHIYGKQETRPFRKMGHVCIVNHQMEEARAIAEKVKNTINVIAI
jgi:5-(carboxyamino)imidazole ribonucleotide synthase